MMQRWTYSQYKAAVKSDIDYALAKHGHLPMQAIGYAHNELALRLEDYPEEAALALTALGSEACALKVLDAYPVDDAFIEEILQHLLPNQVKNIMNALPDSERAAFFADAEALRQAFNSRKSAG